MSPIMYPLTVLIPILLSIDGLTYGSSWRLCWSSGSVAIVDIKAGDGAISREPGVATCSCSR